MQEQYQLAVQRLAEQARNNRTTRKSDSMLPKICKEDRFIDRVNILCPATPRPEMTNAPEQVEEGTFGVPPPPDTDDEVIGRWIKMRLRGHPTKMIDYRFAVPFDPRVSYITINSSFNAIHIKPFGTGRYSSIRGRDSERKQALRAACSVSLYCSYVPFVFT